MMWYRLILFVFIIGFHVNSYSKVIKEENFSLQNIFLPFHQGETSFKIIKNDSTLKKMLVNNYKLAWDYQQARRNEEAYKYYFLSLKIAKQLSDTVSVVGLSNNLANVQLRLGDYLGASVSCVTGLEWLNNNRSTTPKGLYNTYARANKELKNFEIANQAFQNSLQYAETPSDSLKVLNNQGVNYREAGDFKKAILHFENLLAFNSINEYPRSHGRILDNLGYTLFKANKPGAIKYLEQAKNLREKNDDRRGLLASYRQLGEYYLEKNPEKALENINLGLALCEEFNDIDDKIILLQQLVRVKANPKSEAILLAHLMDSVAQAKQFEQNKYAATKYETEQKEKENNQLKIDKAAQEVVAQKAKQRNWGLGFGLLLVSLGGGFYWNRYKKEQKAKNTIASQKETIEELQKELHHRVKNNLNIINAFVEELKEGLGDKLSKQKFDELQHRIQSINEVHTQLYQNTDVTQVEIGKYVSKLTNGIAKTYNNSKVKIIHEIENDLKLSADKASVVGLIVNEFVTNSYKYAFDNGEGDIRVKMNEANNNYHLTLSDSGKGLPEVFDLKNSPTYGLRIIQLLAKQLGGNVTLENRNGLHLILNFSK